MIALALALVVTAAVPPQEVAARAAAVKSPNPGGPVLDEALSRAAASLAGRALAVSARRASDGAAVQRAVSEAGASDADVRVTVVVAMTAEAATAALAERLAEAGDRPATHWGFGEAHAGDRLAAVLLFTERRAVAEAFPRRVAVGGRHRLSGRLLAGLSEPSFYVTRPDGRIDYADSEARDPDKFSRALAFPVAGRYTVEVIARGASGPLIAALFDVVALPPGAPAALDVVEPAQPAAGGDEVAAVLAAIQRRRQALGLPALAADPDLAAVAQAHADDMARRAYFGHVSPEGKDAGGRLKAAGYGFRAVLENLGEARTPLDAHGGIERSPGHLAAVLDREATRVGVASARLRRGGDESVVLVELFARPTREATGDEAEHVFAALNAERDRRNLDRLARLRALDALAQEHVAALAKAGDPAFKPAGAPLAARAAKALPRAEQIALDVFVADAPRDAVSSANLGRAFNRAGVGALRAASAKYGAERLWIVVIFASVP